MPRKWLYHGQQKVTALLSCLSEFDSWMYQPTNQPASQPTNQPTNHIAYIHFLSILHIIQRQMIWKRSVCFFELGWYRSQPTGDRKKNTGMHNELKLALRTYPTLCHCYPTYPIPLRTFFCSTCAQRIGHFGSHLSMLPETEPALSPGWWYHW